MTRVRWKGLLTVSSLQFILLLAHLFSSSLLSPLSHTLATLSRFCLAVYFAERATALGKDWHKVSTSGRREKCMKKRMKERWTAAPHLFCHLALLNCVVARAGVPQMHKVQQDPGCWQLPRTRGQALLREAVLPGTPQGRQEERRKEEGGAEVSRAARG